jgi:cell pole-organizing protein PopZ
MNMASSPQHEPTMEEILASIRKIISEDSTEQPQAAQTQPAVQARSAEPDVLELTEEVHEEQVTAAPAPVATPVEEAVAVQPAPQPVADDVVFQSIEETPVSSPAPTPLHSGEGIFSDKARKALSDAFADVDAEPEAPPASIAPVAPVAAVVPVDGLSVESVFDRAVRETFDPVLQKWLGDNADGLVERMKPLITEWLDTHFPPMLEEAVRTELARAKARPR